MKVYGYCRVSTKHQSIKRQIENIKEYCPDAEIYEEAYTGTTMERPVFQKLLNKVRSGDTIVFDEISRMTREADKGFQLYKKMMQDGVKLVFLKERTLDTENFATVQQIAFTGQEIADIYIEATNRVLLLLAEQQIKAALAGAEHEAKFIQKRTKDGMRSNHAAEKISASRTGMSYETKKAREAKEKIRSIKERARLNVDEICKIAGCSRNSYFKYCREIAAEGVKK